MDIEVWDGLESHRRTINIRNNNKTIHIHIDCISMLCAHQQIVIIIMQISENITNIAHVIMKIRPMFSVQREPLGTISTSKHEWQFNCNVLAITAMSGARWPFNAYDMLFKALVI